MNGTEYESGRILLVAYDPMMGKALRISSWTGFDSVSNISITSLPNLFNALRIFINPSWLKAAKNRCSNCKFSKFKLKLSKSFKIFKTQNKIYEIHIEFWKITFSMNCRLSGCIVLNFVLIISLKPINLPKSPAASFWNASSIRWYGSQIKVLLQIFSQCYARNNLEV